MKHYSSKLVACVVITMLSFLNYSVVSAQQLPDPHFEDWSGAEFNGKPQLKSWQISNVSQTVLGVTAKANMGEKTTGRTGSALKVYDAEIGAAGVTETSPGYATCGEVWLYFAGLANLDASTAGSKGGIKFTYRPDSIAVWVKREGADVAKQAYQIIFYSWKGTAKGTSYKGKDGSCTNYSVENEESDIRQKNDANECNTSQYATQIAEGWLRDTVKQGYSEWTRISIPINYFVANEKPEMCNVIFSAGNYPNKRDPKGLYAGLSLTVDDVELIYNSTIDELRINDTKVRGFSASTLEFTKANEKASYSPAAEDFTLFRSGRQLDASEYTININGAAVDNDTPVLITVKAEDGSSQTTYQIKFTSTQSSNYRPESITYKLGDKEYTLPNWNANAYNYEVSLPYGTTQTPQVIVTKSEASQTEKITQPTGPTGTATVVMTAQNGASQTYTIKFTVAQLTDNTLKDILINGESLVGFSATKNNYDVELPLGTTKTPEVTWVSNYPAGAQTITLTSNELNGSEGKATITVQVPGNKTVRTYTLNYIIKASSYAYLADLKVGGVTIDGFDPGTRNYFYDLPMGTQTLPTVTYEKGQAGQTITIDDSGIVNLSGDYKITVKAEDGKTVIYTIKFTLSLSSNVDLKAIYVNGKAIPNFSPEVLEYSVEVDASLTEPSVVTVDVGEEGQALSISSLDGPEGSVTVRVTALDNKTRRTYTINIYQNKSSDNTLKEILVNGVALEGFDPLTTEYTYTYTDAKPTVTYTVNDPTATVTMRDKNGVVTFIVTAQNGEKNTYYLTLQQEVVEKSDYAYLEAIYINGVAIPDFQTTQLTYDYELTPFAKPEVTYDAQASISSVAPTLTWNTRYNIYTAKLVVTAENGVAQNTYTINFIEGQGGGDNKSNDATLSNLLIDGVQVDGFAAATTSYSFEVSAGGAVPTVSATANHSGAKIDITQAASTSGQATVVVTAEDGKTKKNYTIQFTESTDPRSTDATLKSVVISGNGSWSRTFTPSIFEYTYFLPSATTEVPQVECQANSTTAVVSIKQAQSVSDDAIITVTAENPDYTRVYTVHFTTQKSTDASLSSLTIDAQGSWNITFAPEVHDYIFTLPEGTTDVPQVNYTVNSPLATAQYQAAEDVNGVATIVVTAENTDYQITYTIRFSVDQPLIVDPSTMLNMIYLDGVELQNFESDKLEYYVNLGDAMIVPVITIEKKNQLQIVEISSPRTNDLAQIIVTSADNTQKAIYQIHFIGNIVTTPKQNPQLTSLSVNGTEVQGFSPDTYEYSVAIPADINSWSGLISYEVNDDTRSDMLQKSDFVQNGECLIILMSQDGSVTNVYKLHFVPQKSSDATLASVYFDGVAFAGFSPFTFTYDLTDISVPKLTYTKKDNLQTVIYREQTNTKIELEVIAADGLSSHTYQFAFKASSTGGGQVGGDTNTRIKQIKVGEQTKDFGDDFDFDPYRTTFGSTEVLWTVDMPVGEDQLPNIEVTPSVSTSKVYLQTEMSKGQATVHVQIVPQDRSWAEAYIIHLNFHQSQNAALKSITYGETTILAADFPANKIFDIDLPVGVEYPDVSYELGEEHQVVALLDNKTSKTIISVQAQDENAEPEIYVLNFKKGLSADNKLKQIYVDGISQGVEPIINYAVPEGQKELPVVTYEANSESQNILQIDNGKDGATIIVVAENGEPYIYKVNFVNGSTTSTLKDLQVYKDGSLTSIFADGTNDYEVTVSGDDAVQVPAVMPVPTDENAVITVTYGWFGEPTIIHVAAPDGDPAHVTDYTITFKQQKSNDATLKGIELVDNALFMFDYDQRKYDNIAIAQDATTHPEIKWEKNDPDQKVQFVDAGFGETTKIIVTSPDGTKTETYEFTFSKVADISENNELKAIFVNGMPVSLGAITDDGKGNKISECSVVLPLGVDSCHIEYVTSYSSQTVLVSNMGMGKTSSLKVLSNREGVDDVTYLVSVKSVVQGININGVPYDKFDPTVYDYIYVEESADDKTPEFVYDSEYITKFPDLEITASSNKKFASLLITDNATGEEYKYTISVYYKADDEKLNLSFDEFTSTKTTGQPMWKFSGLYGGLANDYQHVAYRVKPIGWYAPADCEAIDHLTVGNWITGVREYYAGEEVNESGTIVHTSGGKSVRLYTVYSLPSITSVPGVISLSSQTYSFNTTASLQISTDHTSSFGSPITYRNTPDRISLWHYSPDDISEVAEGVHTGIATGWSLYIENNGTPIVNNDGNLEYAQQWSEYSKDISYGDDYIPNTLDIRISSSKLSVNDGALNPEANLLGTTTANINQRNTRIMYIDDMQFHYNSTITSGRVLNTEGTVSVSGSNINVTLSDPNFKGIPQLVFNNEVSGYQHEILWNEDFTGGTVRSYAENMTYTDYTLTTNSTNSRYLKDILVDGKSVWNGNTTINYTLPYGTTELPNIESVLRDHRQFQTISLEQKAKGQYQALIQVWNSEADYEANPSTPARTYTLNLNWSNTETNTLADIKEGDATIAGFEADKTNYTTEVAYTDKFKTITYTKAQAGQQVTMTVDSISDVKRVVKLEVMPEKQSAESRTYTITQTKQKPLNSFGKLSEVNANGPVLVSEVMLSDKSDNVLPTYFKRDFPTDTVVQTLKQNSIEWVVKGAQATNKYRLDFSTTSVGGSDATLAKLNINGNDENVDVLKHNVKTTSGLRILASKKSEGQEVSTSYNVADSTFIIVVEAADKSDKQTYVIKLSAVLSTQALLNSFVAQGYTLSEPLSDDVFEYTLIPNSVQPMPRRRMPQRAPKNNIFNLFPDIQANAKGVVKEIVVEYKSDRIEIEVFPEDEDALSNIYIFHIQSQDAGLDDISMFGVSVPNFSSSQETYPEWTIDDLGADAEGIQPTVGYKSSNTQQTVVVDPLPAYPENGTIKITVTATNGTKKVYTIPYKYGAAAVSSNCLLDALIVNGKELTNINEPLNKSFDVEGEMLEITPIRKENVQVVDVETQANKAVITVTAQDGKHTNTYTVNFINSVGTSSNTLIDIYLNGIKRNVKDGQQANFIVDDEAEVNWVVSEYGQTVVRSDEGSVIVLDVTAPNGVDKAQYRMSITYNKQYATHLSAIRLDGKEFTQCTQMPHIVTPAKFVPQTTAYRVDMSGDNQELPVIDAVKVADYQTLVWTTTMREANSTSDTLAVVTIKVMVPSNESEIYTLFFVQTSKPEPVVIPCADQLEDILVDGKSWNEQDSISAQFSATIHDYDIYLPAGSEFPSNIEGFISDPDNSCLLLGVPSAQTIDESTRKVTLDMQSFDSNNDITEIVYTVYVHILPYTDATIDKVYINEEDFIEITQDETKYTYTLPVGTRDYPIAETIECEMNEQHATYTITRMDDEEFDYNALYQIHTTAQSGDSKDYYLTFVVEKDDNADLKEVVLIDADGQQISIDDIDFTPDFDADETEYYIVLPRGTQAIPDFSQSIKASQYATMSVEKDLTSPTNGTVTITVTAENGVQKKYIMHVSVDVAHTALLSDIVLDINVLGDVKTQSVDNFDSYLFEYTQALPYGVGNVRQVSITPLPLDNATFTVQRGETFADETTIVVTAEDGVTQNTYTIVFEVQKSTNATPLMLYLDGVAMDATELQINDKTVLVDTTFEPDYYEYFVTLPYGTESLPEVTALPADTQQVISVTTEGFVTTVTVQAGAGRPTNQYLIDFEFAKCATNTLDDLTISGRTVDGFSSDINDYSVVYPAGTSMDSIFSTDDIAWTLTDPATSTAEISHPDSLTWLITVTAENGSQNVYVVSALLSLSNNALLDSLLIDGVMIDGFNPTVFDYTYYIYQGQPLPEVAAVPQDSDANVTIQLGDLDDYTYIKVVAADDSTETRYSVLFATSPNDLSATPTDEDVCLRHIANGVYMASAAKRNVQLCIFDISGHLLQFVSVPLIEANETVCESQIGVEIKLQPNQPYIYLFVNNLKNKVTRGKVMYRGE